MNASIGPPPQHVSMHLERAAVPDEAEVRSFFFKLL
jgi:hypothetical protein